MSFLATYLNLNIPDMVLKIETMDKKVKLGTVSVFLILVLIIRLISSILVLISLQILELFTTLTIVT